MSVRNDAEMLKEKFHLSRTNVRSVELVVPTFFIKLI